MKSFFLIVCFFFSYLAVCQKNTHILPSPVVCIEQEDKLYFDSTISVDFSKIQKGVTTLNSEVKIDSVHSINIIEAFEKFQPEMTGLFLKGFEDYNTHSEAAFINENYANAENVSIDYAVLEKAKNVYVLPTTFDWNDLGTWGSLHEKLDKDENNNAVVNAKVVLKNSSSNIISTSKDKLVIIDGLEDFIIVDKDNVLLIYPKSKEQEIKGLVASLKQ